MTSSSDSPNTDVFARLSSLSRPSGPRAAPRPIQRIPLPLAQQMRSAQVVLDPAAILKELLENALDARATRVDARLRGKAALQSIVVSDNGGGVAEDDQETLCLPGTTSKLEAFEELEGGVGTLGFRGEALSAICGVAAGVTVVTKGGVATPAAVLKYGEDGKLVERSAGARGMGTTVSVEGVFERLPVRKKDAIKNSGREIARCVAVVQALALVAVDVRMELRVGGDMKVMSQPARVNKGVRDASGKLNLEKLRVTAGSILGKRAVATLAEVCCGDIDAAAAARASMEEGGLVSGSKRPLGYGCRGLISSAALDANGGGGRTKSSHQFVYANRRPVDFPRLCRAVTELYRRVTGFGSASPVLILNLELPPGSHDVNLAPDKRSLFIREEEQLIGGVLAVLEGVWAPRKAAVIPMRRLEQSTFKESLLENGKNGGGGDRVGSVDLTLKRSLRSATPMSAPELPAAESLPAAARPPENPQRRSEPDENTARRASHSSGGGVVLGEEAQSKGAGAGSEIDSATRFGMSDAPAQEVQDCLGVACETGGEPPKEQSLLNAVVKSPSQKEGPGGQNSPLAAARQVKTPAERLRLSQSLSASAGKRNVTSFIARRSGSSGAAMKRPRTNFMTGSTALGEKDVRVDVEPVPTSERPASGNLRVLARESKRAPVPETRESEDEARDSVEVDVCTDAPAALPLQKGRVRIPPVVRIDWDAICGVVPDEQRRDGETTEWTDTRAETAAAEALPTGAFKNASLAEVNPVLGHPLANAEAAELEMSRLFRQEWFRDMEVLGQFNRGFIICRLGRDLFIVDQHASDEKYNFEDLQKTTVITKQKLVRPLALEFSAEDELVVLEHLEAFRAGGFGIEYRAEKNPTQRLYLRSQPMSKRTMFVREDLQEMVAMLKHTVLQSSSVKVKILRPPRIRAMFASRACRKSIMIGTALRKAQMVRVVRHLAEIEHPWTCPHGRPTMRHLFALPNA